MFGLQASCLGRCKKTWSFRIFWADGRRGLTVVLGISGVLPHSLPPQGIFIRKTKAEKSDFVSPAWGLGL